MTLETPVPARTIRLLHRIAVDWTADTFGLRGAFARSRHDDARDRARGPARRLPAALHRPREPRVLRSWQGPISRVAAKARVRS